MDNKENPKKEKKSLKKWQKVVLGVTFTGITLGIGGLVWVKTTESGKKTWSTIKGWFKKNEDSTEKVEEVESDKTEMDVVTSDRDNNGYQPYRHGKWNGNRKFYNN